MTRARSWRGGLALALASLALACCAPPLPQSPPRPSPQPEALSYEADPSGIRLSLLGRYPMGFYDIGDAAAVYDPPTRRLFVVSVDRGWIDTVDIADPARPKRIHRQAFSGYGGVPESIALSRGILAVALSDLNATLPGRVLFFDTDGKAVGAAVRVGVQPVQLRFTPDGRELVVANQGEADASYTIDPEGSISIVDLGIEDADCRGGACDIAPSVVQLDFQAFDRAKSALRRKGVRIVGPGASVAQDLEPEAVAIAPDGATAWVSLQRNNAMAVLDLASRTITDIIALGAKDHGHPDAGLDGSAVDGKVNIRPWPIRGLYEPGMVEAYAVDGETFLVTANGGDPRESDAFVEDTELHDLRLDPEVFPNAALLQEDGNLGRLRVSRVEGDVDGDGAFDRIFAFGGRSFAIWTGQGALAFDSGDDLERIMAEAVPSCFNCAGGSRTFDEQSDDRGPEPDALAIGRIDGRPYAFIAAERIGGIYVYDIADPRAAVFQQYVNFRDFSVDPGRACEAGARPSEACAAAGDLQPAGVLFIAAADSPIGVPLVVVPHALSGSTTIYRVDRR